MAYTFKPSTWEAVADRVATWSTGRLTRETLSQ